MKTLCKYKKHHILHSYLLKLPKPLGQAFGKSDFYTPAQVRVCLGQAKLSASYDYYAYAIFCEQVDFDVYMQSQD
ncbi:DUF6559 family protein [Psychrobacter sp. FDAARGOS_221]|uniref:DUF6559 family protein n=1 Tax=Psychrobacter sp. FDAARGOS_221 TaxID=1975705 RepID=UPI000BB57834|nr:hypothetical protein A6J60_002065 [Psychrobacter sp. FDAARGOS_221]